MRRRRQLQIPRSGKSNQACSFPPLQPQLRSSVSEDLLELATGTHSFQYFGHHGGYSPTRAVGLLYLVYPIQKPSFSSRHSHIQPAITIDISESRRAKYPVPCHLWKPIRFCPLASHACTKYPAETMMASGIPSPVMSPIAGAARNCTSSI